MIDTLASKGPFYIERGSYAFTTPFLLVYGTLRKDNSNYKNYLEPPNGNPSEVIGSYILPGWTAKGLMAWPTSNPEDGLVVDLIELKGSDIEIYETNLMLDRLEGTAVINQYFLEAKGYRQIVLPIQHPTVKDHPMIYVKIYGFPQEMKIGDEPRITGIVDLKRQITLAEQLPHIQVVTV